MTRKSLMVGNWKMNSNHLEAIQMLQKLHYRLDVNDYDRVDVGVAPPFTSLRSVQTVIEADHMSIKLAAQNCHFEEKGAYTGEVAPSMLAKLSVDFVIVGHSERRQIFGETDDWVNRKAKAVLAHDMTPIVCVGESLEEREADLAFDRVGSQIQQSLTGLSAEQIEAIVVAYEPIWAIGTGRTADPSDAQEMIEFIRGQLDRQWGSAAQQTRILYGGSVNPGNIGAIMAKKDIDGGLVGGASLDPDTFASVVRYWI
ncbi:MAG: triose-phosphate isomerase [Acidimicrobiia bacterium]|jgi:triosephosphate isomerase|nr:triose-phosphate isomerase [Acidimicrobiia bacterium]